MLNRFDQLNHLVPVAHRHRGAGMGGHTLNMDEQWVVS